MASLQVNQEHICGAGMFKLGFFISTGTCVSKIEKEKQNSQVAVGEGLLSKAQRLKILNLDFHPFYNTANKELHPLDYDIGVVMVSRLKQSSSGKEGG